MANLLFASAIAFSCNEPLYTLTIAEHAWIQPNTSIVNFTSSTSIIKPSSLNAREIIEWLRKEGLPVSAIADIARVERKSVYAWINDGPVRHQNYERLDKLYRVFSEGTQLSLLDIYRYWKRTLSNGKSLAFLLTEEDLDDKAIKKALLEIEPLAKKTQRLTSQARKTQQTKNNPLLDEMGEATLSDE